MPLAASQIELLQKALLSAFDGASLAQMVYTHLGEDLSTVAGEGNPSAVVSNLIAWAERTGRTEELIKGAFAGNPQDSNLKNSIDQRSEANDGMFPTPDSEHLHSSSSRTAKAGDPPLREVNTQGGAHVAGSVATGGGDFVGRDKINVSQMIIQIGAQAQNPVPSLEQVSLSLPFETVSIPAGPFLMGSPPGIGIPIYETPQFECVLPAFVIGKYPVTNAQYEEYVGAMHVYVPPEVGWDGQTAPRAIRAQPISGVTWYEALAYCKWLSDQTHRLCRLPTEAMWEKAARGEDGRRYPWGNTWEEGRSNQGAGGMADVTAYPPQSPYGCCDMVGNVRQWVASLWGERLQTPDEAYLYTTAAANRSAPVPAAEDASDIVRRIWRGGSYLDPKEQLRCAFRGASFPTRAGPPNLRMGFRVMVVV